VSREEVSSVSGKASNNSRMVSGMVRFIGYRINQCILKRAFKLLRSTPTTRPGWSFSVIDSHRGAACIRCTDIEGEVIHVLAIADVILDSRAGGRATTDE